MARSFRFWLALGLSTLVALAVLTVVSALLGILLPRLNAEVETRNHALGEAAAAQVESFLGQSTGEIERLAGDIAALPAVAAPSLRVMLETLANVDLQLEAIYLVDERDRVIEVGLPIERRGLRGDLIGVDFSGRAFVRAARHERRNVWSDTYLSPRGRIVVALAVPLLLPGRSGDAAHGALVAELDLHELSRFTRAIGSAGETLSVIVDRRGQIVGHPDPERSLRQENLSHLPLLREAAAGGARTALFRLDAIDYIGSTTAIRGPGWTALVAQPTAKAFATVRATLLALAAASLLALSLALAAAFVASRRMTRRVAEFGQHLQAIAAGDYRAPIPRSGTDEIEGLAQSMRRMAEAVVEREVRLQASEAKYRDLVEGTRDLITRVDRSGRLLFVNPMAATYFGMPAAECLGLSAFDFVHRDDRAATEAAFAQWLAAGGSAAIQFENRQIARGGGVHRLQWNIVADRAADGEIVGFSSIARDVTAERQAEEALAASEERYRGLFSNAPLAYQSLDLSARLVEVNDAWLQLLGGYRREEVIGRPLGDFIAAHSLPTLAEHFPNFVAAGRLDGPVFDLRCKDGATRTVAINGRIGHDPGGEARAHCILSDITERLHAEAERKRSEEGLRLAASVFESTAEGIMVTDAERRIISVNPALIAITGYGSDEVVGKTPAVFRSGRHEREFYREMWAAIQRDGLWRGEIWNRRKNGEVFPEWLTITAVRDGDGKVTHYIGSFFDISERKQAEEHIRFLAHHDALTKLPNRALLDDRIRQAIALSRRNGDYTAVMFLDLDRFKLVNDTLGHDIGDRLLEGVAEALCGVLRETETVARLGGDEFVVVIPELAEIDRAAVVARKVIDVVSLPHTIAGRVLHVTPSVGVSIFPTDGEDPAVLLRNADTAMYHAKERGRNNFQFFTPAMNVVVQERVAIENDLHLALERGEFLLHYQPQVDSRSGEIRGMEALIRWQHPQRGMIAPDRFIAIAEETGLIVPIGEWVLDEACRQARRWHDSGQSGLRIGVNLSARQFQQPDLSARIAAAISASGIEPSTLELELTESMLMADPDAATDVLRQLAALGVKMAIDDFGTGYSSLAYLKRFPVTRLKIDRSFVSDLSTDANDAAIVNAVVAMAASLKLEVIAEGVETIGQLNYLAAHGCHEIQGFYFSRPQLAANFTSFRFTSPLSGG